MSHSEILESKLRQTAHRRRLMRAWRGFWLGFLAAAAIWLTGLAAFKLLPLPAETLLWTAILAAVSVLALLGWAAWKLEAKTQVARWLDETQRLQERVATALEIQTQSVPPTWRQLVVSDAVRHLETIDCRRLLPWALPRVSRHVLLLLALGAGLGLVPEYRSPAQRQKAREAAAIQEAGRKLAEVARRSPERQAKELAKAQETVKAVGELGAQLSRHPPTLQEAMRELAKLADKTQQEAKSLLQNPALRAMEKASRSGSQSPPAPTEEMQKQIESLRNQLGENEPKPEALQKLEEALRKAREAAAQMSNLGAQASGEQRQALDKALSNLARQAREAGVPLDGIKDAMEALQTAKMDQVLRDLESADKDLNRLKELADSLKKMQQQALDPGKTLAEQLEKGQGEAAAATLRQMAKQLSSRQATAEQLKDLTRELDKALKPAAQYAKVPDHLRQALRQIQQGEQSEAAGSLSKAAGELDSMSEQMAGLDDLRSAADALRRAQLALGNGAGSAQARSNRPGSRPGKPGQGVGTWADESLSIDPPERSDSWDNSAVQREDRAARGLTDRGEAALPEGVLPTRVRGQMNPGNSMPSITLRGVSLKGQSSVQIKEAVTAAQTEAENALSQDQVPRAYQGAVKDYFDDLKK